MGRLRMDEPARVALARRVMRLQADLRLRAHVSVDGRFGAAIS